MIQGRGWCWMWWFVLLAVVLGVGACRKAPDAGGGGTGSTLHVVVTDPLTAGTEAGSWRRDYTQLGAFLEQQLGRPIVLSFVSDLAAARQQVGAPVDVIIGQYSTVQHQAAQAHLRVRPVAMLTDREGQTTQRGLFVVRSEDPTQKLADLRDRKILLGPSYAEEQHAAALRALSNEWIFLSSDDVTTAETCGEAALAVVDGRADATVLSSYCLPLLEARGTIKKGSLRVIGHTEPVPFITVFATSRLDAVDRERLVAALVDAGQDPALAQALESRSGFVRLSDPAASIGVPWTDWRGAWRDAVSDYVPDLLPELPRYRWKVPLTGPGRSGLAATEQLLIVADKDAEGKNDIWRGISTDSGEEIWTLSYAAQGDPEGTNSPRANPVIVGDQAHLLSAFGDLYCVSTRNGRESWKRNIIRDFGATAPAGGVCATPLVVGDKIIVHPGGVRPEGQDSPPEGVETYAGIVALDRHTGQTLWATPGGPAAKASFIVGTFGGRRQIVGYDADSLGGWDIDTGERLWRLVPPQDGDVNAATPINAGGKLLVATENNGTRLYAFAADGTIKPQPIAVNPDLAPDGHTPVLYGGCVFGASGGRLYCLDADTLATRWTWEDEVFEDYVSIIAGNGRLLITTVTGEMILMETAADKPAVLSRIALFGLEPMEVLSHPALLRGRIFVRGSRSLMCLVPDPSEPAVTDATQEITLFDGKTMGHWVEAPFLGRSDVRIENGAIVMEKGHDMTGVTWTGPLFRENYEITLQGMRVAGEDFFCGLTFPVGRQVCSLICGGWGGTLVGISCINYYDAANNETGTSYSFKTGQWHDIRVRVTPDRIRAWIDGEELVNCRIADRHLSVRFEMEPSRPLGIATWQTTGTVRNLVWKRIVPGPEDEADDEMEGLY